MNLTCPSCYAAHALEAYAQTDAQRELLAALVKAPPEVFRPLVAYLGLFRPATRALAPDRALRLVVEVLEIGADPRALATALAETVEAMRAKRLAGDVRPLKNHNYLRRVLEGIVGAGPCACPDQGAHGGAPPHEIGPVRGKRRQAVELLGEWGKTSRLRQAIAIGLTGLVAIGRPGTPAADMIQANAEMWLHLLTKQGLVESDEDVERVHRAFSALCREPLKDWPEPAAILPHLPRRRRQERLDAPPPSEKDLARGKEFFKGIQETI